MVHEEMSLKKFLIWSYGVPPVQLSRTIYAIVKGIMGIIHVNLYEIWTSGLGGDVFKEKV